MDILTPEDRIELWRLIKESEGSRRTMALHVFSQEVLGAMGALDLYADYVDFVVDTVSLLDDAGLLARDSVRLAFEDVHEGEQGAETLAAEFAVLLREAAEVEELGVDRRVRAMERAGEWREHLLTRSGMDTEYMSVADVAGRFEVTTQAVYKWLDKGRIEGEKRPGGSWRIPAAQFEPVGERPRFDEARAAKLRQTLIELHGDAPAPTDDEITSLVRPDN
jgi:excisionase family DNA binding protein